MTRLADAIATFRSLGAAFAGPVRITNWSDSARGMNVSFRLDVAPKDQPDANPAEHPFKGAFCSPTSGQRFMLVAIMLGDEEAAPEPRAAAPIPTANHEPAAAPQKDRRRLHDVPLPQRAGMLVNDRQFWEWAGDGLDAISNVADADHWLKMKCGIDSKRELATDEEAALRFLDLERDFLHWKNLPPLSAYEDMPR